MFDALDKNWENIRTGTYITCLSEHENNEDAHGRLSMWRAFGVNATRVALVANVPFFAGAALSLRIAFSPVAYFTEAQLYAELEEMISNITKEAEFVRTIPRPMLLDLFYRVFISVTVSLKHEGFSEEKEWRVIYAPNTLGASDLMKSEIHSIAGVPQRLFVLPFDREVSDDIASLDLGIIFDRLIIGPSPYPYSMSEAFVEELNKIGVADARNRVVGSGIPLRS